MDFSKLFSRKLGIVALIAYLIYSVPTLSAPEAVVKMGALAALGAAYLFVQGKGDRQADTQKYIKELTEANKANAPRPAHESNPNVN